MRQRAVMGALVVAGLTIGVVVALLGWAPGAHQPSVGEWLIQTALLVGAVVIVVGRVRRKG
jgi:hypothetical protein